VASSKVSAQPCPPPPPPSPPLHQVDAA
jgi:hypothetical protein